MKVTFPAALEGPEAAEIVSVGPRSEASVTVLPATGLPLASFRVTVIVDVLTPFAGTEAGLADTVEFASAAAPAVKRCR